MGALLPLTAKAKKVALIGPMADNQRELLGAWAVAGDPKYVVTLKTALTERLGDRLLYAQGCGLLSGEDANVLQNVSFGGANCCGTKRLPIPDDDKTIAEAVETAKKADVAILALGEPTNWMEGEASSRVPPGFHRRAAAASGGGRGYRQAGDSGGAGRPSAGAEVGRRRMCPRFLRRGAPALRPVTPWPMCCLAT